MSSLVIFVVIRCVGMLSTQLAACISYFGPIQKLESYASLRRKSITDFYQNHSFRRKFYMYAWWVVGYRDKFPICFKLLRNYTARIFCRIMMGLQQTLIHPTDLSEIDAFTSENSIILPGNFFLGKYFHFCCHLFFNLLYIY